MERQNSFLEVGNTEKQMLSLIYSKGILDSDVLELYHQTRTKYEQLLLSNNHMAEPQEVEFHLWKLHYALIDEFRKKIKKQSWNAENNNKDKGFDVFRSFLFEASEFYKKLIVKLRKLYGLPSEIFLKKKDHSSFDVDYTKLHSCEKTCHRLLVCLGDLARYTEIMKKPESCEWSTAAMYYLEAARTWPDSGNPHNQLALLARYVGDPFLALYHCVRSLAVREPFPDAWRNIMLLFEENRSTKLPPISNQAQFDFLNPSRRSNLKNTYNREDLWPVLVRTISILLTSSNLDEFSCTFASFLHCLEAFLALNVTEIAVSLQAYQLMDSSRKGPYRAIQLVSVFIFIVHSLTETPEREESKAKDDQIQTAPLALAAILICMGRLTERCMTGNNPMHCCPLMPAVLAFSEWLLGALNTVRSYDADLRVRNALSYYTGALSELAERIQIHPNVEITAVTDHSALWEDHELRGFYPLHQVHVILDFTANQECMRDYHGGMLCRLHRTFSAATKITEMSKPEETKPNSSPKPDEEEVILFKPITRRNSAPLYISKSTEDQISPELGQQMQTDHDWLRRATSLSSTSQSTEDNNSFTFTTSFNLKEAKDPATAPTGPPSLSAWVLSSKGSSNELAKPKLSPIDEVAATSFSDLSISETKNSNVETGHISTIVHSSVPSTPAPSAPLLPDDPIWLRRNYPVGHDADGILGAPPPVGAYTSWYPPPPPPPRFGMMSSSEWLYHYRNGHDMMHFNTHSNDNYNNPSAFGNFDLCDQWGNHFVSNPMMYLGSSEQVYADRSGLVYGAEELKRDKYFLGYQRAFPYVCGVGMELGSEQPPLLHHLKEKEKQLQPSPQLRGPPFI